MQKILLIGLNGAGKTALYQKYFLKKPPVQLLQIPPTKGIAKYEHDFLRSDFIIFDTGGGKEYRQGYITNTELAKGVSAVVFVVDVQDVSKYQEAANYFSLWIKNMEEYLKETKGYLLFNKIDPGTETKIKNNLEQLARLIAPVNNLFPGELYTSITSIYSDSSNQIFQRMLLDILPRKMSKVRPERMGESTLSPETSVLAPISEDSYFTTAMKIDTSPSKLPPRELKLPPKDFALTQKTSPIEKSPPVNPPKLDIPPSKESTSPIIPPSISKAPSTRQADVDRIKDKTAERLTDIIEATLDNNPNFIAIAVYTEQVERLVGAVQQGSNPAILQTIEMTLKKIDVTQYMSKLGKARVGGEGHIKIDTFDIFFERVSPDHLSTIICSSLQEETVQNIAQLNRYLNQALSVTPEGISDEAFKRTDLMTELKMRLFNRGKSADELL